MRLLLILLAVAATTVALAQDVSPLRDRHVWLPMTGVTPEQMDDAVSAGYDTVMLKIHPSPAPDGALDFSIHEEVIGWATERGLGLILAVLGWVGLGDGEFYDTDASGEQIPNRLDPFWPRAMARLEWYYGEVLRHYADDPNVVAFAPTWGIYGEAGFSRPTAGYSVHALARFNEWRAKEGLPPLERVPTQAAGPGTDYNLFIRFRWMYIEREFSAMIQRLKTRAPGIPVGMWQELYAVSGYEWNMVEVPSADFALYESCFTFQSVHHPEKSLGETMGFRYRCASAEDYRNYYTPLLARKRGEGQRFMGCQLSNDYTANYGWPEGYAESIGFDGWEDDFGPYLAQLLDAPLEWPRRDVLFVFPTYAAAALSGHLVHNADVALLDTELRALGCQIDRRGMPAVDKMSPADFSRYSLVVVPCSAYLMADTYAKLSASTCVVLFTGCFAQSFDGDYTPGGAERAVGGVTRCYVVRPPGAVSVSADHDLTAGLATMLEETPVTLPDDETFDYIGEPAAVRVLLRCGDASLLSMSHADRFVYIHGHLIAGASYDEDRVPPQLTGSEDVSCNEQDMWGPYSATNPQNAFARAVLRNVLDHAGVDYRVPSPPPRGLAPFLGDNLEQASVSANLAYNNMGEERTITVRLPYRPAGWPSVLVRGRFEAPVSIPAFSYVVLRPERQRDVE